MKIAVITAVWRRPAVTALFWQGLAHLRDWWAPHEVVFVAAGSQEPDHEAMARAAGAEYVDVPNEPLGQKFNAALAQARTHDPDAVFIMGSDDFLDRRVAEAYRPYLRSDGYVGLKDFWFLETMQERRFGYWPGYSHRHRWGEPAGSGRLLPRHHLEVLGWELWASHKHNGMDHSAFQRLKEVGIGLPDLIVARDVGGCAVGLKSGTNIWPYNQVGPRPEDDRSILQRLPLDVQAGLRALGA